MYFNRLGEIGHSRFGPSIDAANLSLEEVVNKIQTIMHLYK